MASILDSAVLIQKEAVYSVIPTGTTYSSAALWLASEAQADTFKRSQEYLESVGMRGALQTTPSDRRRTIPMGGEGTITFDIPDRGFVRYLEGLLSPTPPTSAVVSATSGRAWTVQTGTEGPSASYTIQVQRPDVAGVIQSYNHVGSMITEWSMKADVGGLFNFEAKFDCADIVTGAQVTPVSGAVPGSASITANPASIFDWTRVQVRWGGDTSAYNLDTRSLEFTANLALKTDRRFLRNSYIKKKPIRNGVPEFTGSFEIDFDQTAGNMASGMYADYVAGTTRSMYILVEGTQVSGAVNRSLKISIDKAQFSGGDPEVSLTDTPKQTLPFKVLYDPSTGNPAVKIEYTTIDTWT